MQPHWEALTKAIKEAYQLVSKLPFISEFYLAGGTGLALQIGHRISIDLDFFSDSPNALVTDQRQAILKILKDDSTLKITWDKEGTFVVTWQNVGVSFFRLTQNPLIAPPYIIDHLKVASIEEIGAMKLAAIVSRGTRKDYVDLYFILQQKNLMQLFEVASKKYPYHQAFPAFAIRALSYFEDAESEPQPRMLQEVKWTAIKSFLERQALATGRQQLELEKLR
jgi:predicted nucleotidyltransferase component of viral defense system